MLSACTETPTPPKAGPGTAGILPARSRHARRRRGKRDRCPPLPRRVETCRRDANPAEGGARDRGHPARTFAPRAAPARGTASYRGSGGVRADMSNPSANTGHAAGDVYLYIENLEGSSGPDILVGDGGDNKIWAWGGADTLNGGAGDDILHGGAGADTLNGGADADTASYRWAKAGVSVDLNAGTGSRGDANGDRLSNIENLVGSPHGDALKGTASANGIEGLDGDDTLEGLAGNDTIRGGGGNDTIRGGDNDDTLEGGAGADTIEGGGGADTLKGGAGNDTLDGGAGNDRLEGGARDDTLRGGGDNDTLIGGDGADTLEGGEGNDVLYAGSPDNIADISTISAPPGGTRSWTQSLAYINTLRGGGGDDKLYGGAIGSMEGGAGDDELYGGASAQVLRGGADDDLLVGGGDLSRFDSVANKLRTGDVIDGGPGSDTASYRNAPTGVTASLVAGAAMTGHAKGDVYTSIENLEGSAHNDVLTGDAGANTLKGLGRPRHIGRRRRRRRPRGRRGHRTRRPTRARRRA